MVDKKIKVLIVEDSLVAQRLLTGLVMSDQRFELVAVAENGKQAIELAKKFNPDVISMDIMMPIMDGIETTRKIMQENPTPVLIVSSFYQSSEVEMAIRVLEAGAVSILSRPFGPGHPKFNQSSQKYLNTLQLMSEIKVVRRIKKLVAIPVSKPVTANQPLTIQNSIQNYQVLAIGASAGGPPGLATILSGLPSDFPLPVFVVQHIDVHFAKGFADWLNTSSKLPVHIPVNGEEIMPGNVYLSPGGQHLAIKNNKIDLYNHKEIRGLCPSVDVLFQSVAKQYGKNSIAVLLSGMGRDGATGLKNLYDLGAFTFAQSENSCLVFGMPGEAVKLGAVCKLLTPENIVSEIINLVNINNISI